MPYRPCRRLTLSLAALALTLATAAAGQDDDPPTFDRTDPADENLSTGPEIGERIPDFSGLDQHGKTVSFDDLKGPNGALILFYRSADW